MVSFFEAKNKLIKLNRTYFRVFSLKKNIVSRVFTQPFTKKDNKNGPKQGSQSL